ncbi:hypothetical protein Q765_09060 [Flavobacterium rivuli WB 3.3-2 = DSM 21788]|uniref:FMN dependent NADH:quinone oxidoreductase n=1 Tax=Flavobacterium rivuli WB 3.3-2 = DSM 21788 TaxID=1121895 RepID=A0A0A2M595_9FLAO|nr:NAD(P)H-dependent oxidoreductase [Flavobacterium rivuli]KGO86766.1 hypothetical protein Q765_09060 [Flavobacterium rivuli WB 3.3-2 = DSM 21788]
MNILHVISSPKQKASTSFQLSDAIVKQLLEKHPDGKVEELIPAGFPHASQEFIAAYDLPKHQQTARQNEVLTHSDKAIEQLQRADIIVIGLPLYNFGIPSSLKAWIDQIVRPGIAFTYSEEGIVGLIKNKKAYLALSSGGVYSDGLSHFSEHALNHLKTVLEFIGITDVSTYRAEGLAYPSLMDTALTKAISSIEI